MRKARPSPPRPQQHQRHQQHQRGRATSSAARLCATSPRLCLRVLLVALVVCCLLFVPVTAAYEGSSTATSTSSSSSFHQPPHPRQDAADGERCLYVADSISATQGVLRAYNARNGSLVLSLNLTVTPSALAIDHTRQRLYLAISTSILTLDIAQGLTPVASVCSCSPSFFVNTSIGGVAVEETSGRVYFSYVNNICYVAEGMSSPSCLAFAISDFFGEITISQERQELYALGIFSSRVYRFAFAASGTPTLLSPAFQPNPFDFPYWGITMSHGRILVGVSSLLPGLLMIDPVTGNSVATLTELSSLLGSFTGLSNDNTTGLVYDISRPLAGSYAVHQFALSQAGNILTKSNDMVLVSPLKEPQAAVPGVCPYMAPSPSPSPSPSTVPSSDGDDDDATTLSIAVVVPTVSGAALALCGCCVILVFIFASRRRRRWFDDEHVDDVEMVEHSGSTNFTYREIDSRELKLGKILGKGAFGKVYKGEYRGAVVAIKVFEGVRLDQTDDRLLRELRMEAQLMEKLSNHPNIVKFVGAITKAAEFNDSFALVLEFCPRGSIYDLLVKKKKRLPLITLVRMARDAAFGILHLHKENVIHRDIAARNILVGHNYEVFVSDFGLARVKESDEAGTTKQNFGPVGWMAPEALQNQQYSEATDAFSFGVLLWEVMARKRPWAGTEVAQVIAAVISNTRLKIPCDCDPVFKRLMRQCWRQNPAQRPSFDEIVVELSNYYSTLKKLQDDETEDVELSEDSEEEMTDEARSDISMGMWEQTRIKDEIKTFLKQLISERGEDDFAQVERAYISALHDIRGRYLGSSGGPFPVLPPQDEIEENVTEEAVSAYMSLIKRGQPVSIRPPTEMNTISQAESRTSSILSAIAPRLTELELSRAQLSSSRVPLPPPDVEPDEWMSPYAFPVIDNWRRKTSSHGSSPSSSRKTSPASGSSSSRNATRLTDKGAKTGSAASVDMAAVPPKTPPPRPLRTDRGAASSAPTAGSEVDIRPAEKKAMNCYATVTIPPGPT